MALSMLFDCPNCFDIPCTCGHHYDDMPAETIFRVKQHLESILFERRRIQEQTMKEIVERQGYGGVSGES